MSSGPGTGLADAAIAALRARGAEVRIFAGADNCVRCADAGSARSFVIEVEGVPNLLHELAHVVLLGRVEKDHATDYAAIPFDLTTPRGRALLFDELACCAASCAWHPGDDDAARAWFEEQVGIQGHFFGRPGVAAFLAAADEQVRARPGELEAALGRARAGIERALAEGGASPETARPRRDFPFAPAWRALFPPPPDVTRMPRSPT
jgi:hypothetical protein